jgi:hypothetical protein
MQAHPNTPLRLCPLRHEVGFPYRYGLLQGLPPSCNLFRCSYPIPKLSGRLHEFPRSVGVSLPGLRFHFYPGGPVLTITPLYRQTTLLAYPLPNGKVGADLIPAPSLSFPVQLPMTRRLTVVRLLTLSRRSVAVSPSDKVPRIYLLFLRSFRQFIALCPLPVRMASAP